MSIPLMGVYELTIDPPPTFKALVGQMVEHRTGNTTVMGANLTCFFLLGIIHFFFQVFSALFSSLHICFWYFSCQGKCQARFTFPG